MKCLDVQEGLWKGEMTSDMWEHLKFCRACRDEQDMLRAIGNVMERIDIPTPTRSLLPDPVQIEQALIVPKRKRYTKWLSTGVAAAVFIGIATQVPHFMRQPVSPLVTGSSKKQTAITAPTGQQMQSKITGQKVSANSSTVNNGNVQKQITQLLKKYGWTAANLSADQPQKVSILTRYQDQYGQFPVGLFWAYHNELSKDIGLDMTSYNGQTGLVHILPLKEDWPDGPPGGQTTAVVIEAQGQVVGAWLQKGLSGGYAASLQKHYFADIVPSSWGDWLVQQELEDPKHGVEADMKDWTPEQVVTEYWNSVNGKQYNKAYGLMSKAWQFQQLQMNLAGNQLISNGFEPILGLGLSNILSAKVQKIENADNFFHPNEVGHTGEDKLQNRKPYKQTMLMVTVDLQVNQITGYGNGSNTRFFRLVKETADSPWQIDSISSGP